MIINQRKPKWNFAQAPMEAQAGPECELCCPQYVWDVFLQRSKRMYVMWYVVYYESPTSGKRNFPTGTIN